MRTVGCKLFFGFAAVASLFSLPAAASCGKDLLSRMTASLPPVPESDTTAALTQQAAASGPATAVRGLWLTSVVLQGQTIFQAFESFTTDGLEFLNDNGSPIEGNVCFGVWTITPDNIVNVNHPSWNYDASGNLIGTVFIKSRITTDPGANTFHGVVTIITYDLTGNLVGPEFQAQLVGKRITANSSQ
jgi:hypothetical protein